MPRLTPPQCDRCSNEGTKWYAQKVRRAYVRDTVSRQYVPMGWLCSNGHYQAQEPLGVKRG